MGDKGPFNPEDDVVTAGEYALGLLDPEEVRAVEERLRADRSLTALVADWEARFAAFFAGVSEIDPPAALKQRIDRRLFGARPTRAASLWNSLIFWRGLAASAGALAAVLLAAFFTPAPRVAADQILVAALVPADAQTLTLIQVDLETRRLQLAPFPVDLAGRTAELWLIPEGGAPVSLGIFDAARALDIRLTATDFAKVAIGAAFAISLEPAGGSPTGQPTGPIIALGAVKRLLD